MVLRKLSRTLLKSIGFEVTKEAGDGEEGLRKYKELKPDLVLLDISMPKMNGIDCLKAIRKYDENAKIIICSVLGKEEIVHEAIKLGAIDFIVKPFDRDEFIQKIKYILKKRKIYKEAGEDFKLKIFIIEDLFKTK